MVDASIAAMARANNKILVTRNIANFVDMGVEMVNP
jgi:predicted nucleic acid-binding protein